MQIKQNSPLVDETEKISFIITYYNIDVDMLCQCIDSIMALSLRPSEREIIVIDDGSDVSPIEALRKYDNDIMYVRQSNQGLSAARQKLQVNEAVAKPVGSSIPIWLATTRHEPPTVLSK